ncbi:hypothetical protein ACFYT4_30805 [Streptomyces sp. NPDC004609]|uniref:hypothetical protein n=1 Tax=Streptomyces sp. NPDC004609 TaxID=3364704 RepID=UPI0036B577E1
MRRWSLVLSLGLLLALIGIAPPATAAVERPGDKANFVVSLGSLRDNSRENWTRLGTYTFDTTGTVTARMYLWNQKTPVARDVTGTTPDLSCATGSGTSTTHVRRCETLTAGGFMAAPAETRTGTYTTRTDAAGAQIVHITWQIAQTWTEEWTVRPSADGTLVRLDYKYNSLATHGYGYGSNAEFTTRRPMGTVQAFPGTLKQDLVSWAKDKVGTSNGQTFQHRQFRTCTTETHCLTYVQPSSTAACQKTGGCPNYGGGTAANVTSIQYHLQKISSYDRRDSLWHWCTCLAMERNEFCYTGNSHVKPMLQIIDDNGNFHGWVGAEASFYPSSAGDPRYHDMLSTFRITDFR